MIFGQRRAVTVPVVTLSDAYCAMAVARKPSVGAVRRSTGVVPAGELDVTVVVAPASVRLSSTVDVALGEIASSLFATMRSAIPAADAFVDGPMMRLTPEATRSSIFARAMLALLWSSTSSRTSVFPRMPPSALICATAASAPCFASSPVASEPESESTRPILIVLGLATVGDSVVELPLSLHAGIDERAAPRTEAPSAMEMTRFMNYRSATAQGQA